MPPRRSDPDRLLAAVTAQRAALGRPAWTGPVTATVLGAACVAEVLAALQTGAEPLREALRGATGYLLGLLEERAPGRAVEVRVPPFAAIQCVPGPRHTRGTPPNVVETSAVTWILLATGRLGWAAAVRDGTVHASGPRSDLSPYLPITAADTGDGRRRAAGPAQGSGQPLRTDLRTGPRPGAGADEQAGDARAG